MAIFGGIGGEAHLLDLRGGLAIHRVGPLQGQNDLTSIAISPDGRWIATGTWPHSDDSLWIWNALSGEVVGRLLTKESRTRATFSPDGRWLITSTGQEYGFWEVDSWELRHQIPRGRSGNLLGPVAFTRDGRTLAVAHSRDTIRLLNPVTGLELATLESPDPANIRWLSFSHDGSRLAASTENRIIQLWDLKSIRQQLVRMNLDWDQLSDSDVSGEAAADIERSRPR